MKKIGIITINDYNNYGNRLQNYATQEVLRYLGFSVETIINHSVNSIPYDYIEKESLLKKVKKIKNKSIQQIFQKIRSIKLQKKRMDEFKKFTLNFINESEYVVSNDNVPSSLNNEFDFFISGSDQIWNPVYGHGTPIDFLMFADEEKRIAYAPSFGISEIPSEYEPSFKIGLSKMSKLSVREKSGAEIIKKLTGRDADVLIDPTMMLTAEKWLSVSQPASCKSQGKYLLTYFLGDLPKQNKVRIQKIAKIYSLEIISLLDINCEKAFTAGPGEFIDLINSASIVCTDSFHGVVFSLLLGIPFIVFEREGKEPSMGSRIQTLLAIFDMRNRTIQNITDDHNIMRIDFSKVKAVLENEREKTIRYLSTALND
ncbi:polysaccharide pyruvyl transferase family protein [Sporolactobacillus sp. Y61]|uniref:Polysaccharide pyruvyl transferase family protein n=1 Tax=Sporolactobacillus sp. Y61 TaxID=3160863 RepID=A0AAU8II27_9BACL